VTLGYEKSNWQRNESWLIKALFKDDQKAQNWLEGNPSERRIQKLESDF